MYLNIDISKEIRLKYIIFCFRNILLSDFEGLKYFKFIVIRANSSHQKINLS